MPAGNRPRPCERRYKAKKKAFTKYVAKYSDGKKTLEEELNVLKKHCTVIRVLAHTQIKKIGYGQKKAHLAEIQARAHAPPPALQGLLWLARHWLAHRRGLCCLRPAEPLVFEHFGSLAEVV